MRLCPLPTRVVISRLTELSLHPSKSLRVAVFESLVVIVKTIPKEHIYEHQDAIFKSLRAGLQDAADSVRAISRTLYSSLFGLFPHDMTTYGLEQA